jgi:drug/metabolite transporter (DMT)-like permease
MAIRPGIVVLKVASGLLIVLMSVFVRQLSTTIPVGEIVFCRSAVALVLLLSIFAIQKQLPSSLATQRPASHLARGLTGFAAMALNFLALAYLPVSEAMSLFYLSPVFVVLLAGLLRAEPVSKLGWISLTAGLIGVALILKPNPSGLMNSLVGPLIGLSGALLTAIATLQVHSLARTENTGAITVYFTLIGTVISGCSLLTGWIVPNFQQAWALLGLGVFGAASHVMVTLALARAEASSLAPLEYLNIVWALGLDAAVLGDTPSLLAVFGIFLIITGSLISTKFSTALATSIENETAVLHRGSSQSPRS